MAVGRSGASALLSEFLILKIPSLFPCGVFIRHLACVFPGLSVEWIERQKVCPSASSEMSKFISFADTVFPTYPVKISYLPALEEITHLPLHWLYPRCSHSLSGLCSWRKKTPLTVPLALLTNC